MIIPIETRPNDTNKPTMRPIFAELANPLSVTETVEFFGG
jgi:hypothetical protein